MADKTIQVPVDDPRTWAEKRSREAELIREAKSIELRGDEKAIAAAFRQTVYEFAKRHNLLTETIKVEVVKEGNCLEKIIFTNILIVMPEKDQK